MNDQMSQAHEMNSMLKGIHMGGNSFRILSENANSDELKKILIDILEEMKQHEEKITSCIKEAGINASDKLPLFGKMASIYEEFKYSSLENDFFLTIEAIKVLNMGIEKATIFYYTRKKDVPNYVEEIEMILQNYDKMLIKLKKHLKKY